MIAENQLTGTAAKALNDDGYHCAQPCRSYFVEAVDYGNLPRTIVSVARLSLGNECGASVPRSCYQDFKPTLG